ncbi:hypothetical protein MFIFM68171_09642 [Madurella fahalii]|uniref:Uncharacterized protein n=1 Tax=Madurella fahalii TaxID=1157608 RepID=A0ABQ0GNX9_9PEZI
MKSLVLTETQPHTNLSGMDRHFVQQIIAQLGHPSHSDYWPYHWIEHRFLLVELVLIYASSLEALTFPLYAEWELGVVRHQAIKPFLPKLKCLAVTLPSYTGYRYTLSTHQIESLLLAAPNLEELRTPTLTGPSPQLSLLANLRRLEFWGNCCVAPEILDDIIISCPYLEVVALHWDALDDA